MKKGGNPFFFVNRNVEKTPKNSSSKSVPISSRGGLENPQRRLQKNVVPSRVASKKSRKVKSADESWSNSLKMRAAVYL